MHRAGGAVCSLIHIMTALVQMVPEHAAMFSLQMLHSILILMYQHLFMGLKTVPPRQFNTPVPQNNTFLEMSNNITINKTPFPQHTQNAHSYKGSTPT